MQQAPKETIHVTLVHGTFAPGAAWTKSGSALRNAISEEFDDHVEFHSTFRWWGLPSHLNRHVASKRLRRYLLELTERHKGRHFIIGHSHGALLSLYAVREQELAKRIEGVISLSTPYLIARPRKLSVLGLIAVIFGGLAAFAMLSSLAQIPLAAYFNSDLPWYVGVLAFLFWLALIILMIATLSGLILGVKKLSNWFLTTMEIPSIDSGRLLIVRGPSDEASVLINLFHGIELLISAIWGRRGPFDRLIVATAQRLWAHGQHILGSIPVLLYVITWFWMAIGIFIFLAASIAALVFMEKFPEHAEELIKPAMSHLHSNSIFERIFWGSRSTLLGFLNVIQYYASELLPAWMVSALAVAAFPMFSVLCVVGALFTFAASAGVFSGSLFVIAVLSTAFLAIASVPELGPCAATVVVSVEATPPGQYEVVSGKDTAGSDAFLTHSWSYSHPQALKAIATWLKAPKPDMPLIPPPPPPPPPPRDPNSYNPFH